MLAIITIFLITFLTAATAVWLYRMVSGWQGFNRSLVARPVKPVRTKMGVQQGFISMNSTHPARAKPVRHRSPKGGIKAPWGW